MSNGFTYCGIDGFELKNLVSAKETGGSCLTTHQCRHIFHTNDQYHERHQIIRHDCLPVRVPRRSISPAESQKGHHAEAHDSRAKDLNDAGESDTESRMHGGSPGEEEKEVQDNGGIKEEDV